ncbi:uncharacterized protein PFL1_01005 [Pseudozyma flocculosa PF-1]|uniref:Large ribosomal subunit protein mL53 n=1 Tax=Pseudozyma flocculosa TaxID=84751 RepID=A0A5C3FBN9_9BASI|nr:uncharacterized protein PFL1_01005 [Pseudozyma flocculosa PF-1]EPQ31672.1 hypothetical protein PFL1_01005 [Pseudozyma flocculosa PF-1]SPO40789.1 related to MRPL44 - mitochondrial ribosomal protein, large subunit [Pseudozyma flocculosa]
MSLPASSLRQITSVHLSFAPLSSSQSARSLRLFLARLPARPPAAGMDLPEIKATTVSRDQDQCITVTYRNKQTLQFDEKAVRVGIADLVRKIEAPAKALKLKEEGL